jgi:hypothetical protein
VEPTAVQKHECEERKNLLARGKFSGNLGNRIAGRDQPVDIDECMKPLGMRQLHKEDEYVYRNNATVDNGIGFRTDGVSKRYHNCNDKWFWA